MRRHKKLIPIVISLAALGIVGLVLHQIQQRAVTPFPGAKVVLDDFRWKQRTRLIARGKGYQWTSPDTVLYSQGTENGVKVAKQRINFNGRPESPELLAFILKDKQEPLSLSPDGKILCLHEIVNESLSRYTFVRTDGTGKPVVTKPAAYPLFWTPDSRHLRGIAYMRSPWTADLCDAHTGTAKITPLTYSYPFSLPVVTPQGKLRCLAEIRRDAHNPDVLEWKVADIEGRTPVMTSHRKRLPGGMMPIRLSPDGTRILWRFQYGETSWTQKVWSRLTGRYVPGQQVTRWTVSDLSGNNLRTLGIVSEQNEPWRNLTPEWTPDGKGVHFVKDGKLMYLAVP
jgi:hypothetical protein